MKKAAWYIPVFFCSSGLMHNRWNISDHQSRLDDFPVRGRKDCHSRSTKRINPKKIFISQSPWHNSL